MKSFIQLILTIVAIVLGCFALVAKTIGTMGSAWAGVTLTFASLVLLTANRQRIVGAFEAFRAGQLKVGVFALLLFTGVLGLQAYQNIEDSITSLVIRPSGARTSDTNGLIRLYSANESNFFAITTNLDFVFFTANGAFTGRTHSQIFTNINDTSTRSTNSWKSGVLVSTNGVIAQ